MLNLSERYITCKCIQYHETLYITIIAELKFLFNSCKYSTKVHYSLYLYYYALS